MSFFTYHLINLSIFDSIKLLISPPKSKNIKGLIHVETMSVMNLGSPIISKSRFISKDVVVFAQWENEEIFQDFLNHHSIGKILKNGWFLKLEFLRQWGNISGFQIQNNNSQDASDINPVVAVTLARMKFKEIPRFLQWGRPVEKLVRDHTGTNLSLASIRHPNLVSTFSIWKTQKEMTDMVRGHSHVPDPKRHKNAMIERNRKDFHYEFTTLRFRILDEFGIWKGKSDYSVNQ